MTRIIDQGAIVAAGVGIGVAFTVGISFLLVIPIEPVYWYLTLPAGVLIGYYANQRSDRRQGPWLRIAVNGLSAGFLTGLAFAALLLMVKALFFTADNGYRDASLGGSLSCQPGADCVYQRYVADGRGSDLAGAGVTDASSFTRFYWNQQLTTAGLLLSISSVGGLAGGLLYGIFRPRAPTPRNADEPTG